MSELRCGLVLECDLCKSKNENCCSKMVDTYNARYEDGNWAHGGFASHILANKYFTSRIPDELGTETVAPLRCAGIITYSPLVRAGVYPGKAVGAIGIGGLGPLGVPWAEAFGAETYAFTTTPDKLRTARSLERRMSLLLRRMRAGQTRGSSLLSLDVSFPS